MNHLAVTSILTVVAHIIWFASMTERKYPIKKNGSALWTLRYILHCMGILAYSLLGKRLSVCDSIFICRNHPASNSTFPIYFI